MKKLIVSGAAIVAVVAVAAGGGWIYSQNEAKARFDAVLQKFGYADAMEYGDLSYNPLAGRLVVKNIRLNGDVLGKLQALNPRAEQLVVDDYSAGDNGLIESLHWKMSGITINVADAVELLAGQEQTLEERHLSQALQNVAAFGYPIISADIDASGVYNAETGEASENVTITVDDAATVEYGFELGDLTRETALKLQALSEEFGGRRMVGRSEEFMEAYLDTLGNTRLVSAKVKVVEGGLAERLWTKFDEMTGREPGAPRDDALFRPMTLTREQVLRQVKDPVHADRIVAGNKELIDFLKEPDELTLTVKAGDDFRIQAFVEAIRDRSPELAKMLKTLDYELKS
ncbi:hypothetical protein [Aestuariispira ectoiniformans]|uniref:hypothetical protein n=1 Tax=Aestuariispira ectoiniformans TaxID=2775080 RepID=UPI00223A72D8|nr:hypothetical protein [Aestuariispira ectoiniformans]